MTARRLILFLTLGTAGLILLPVAAYFLQGLVSPEVTDYFEPERVERARALAKEIALSVALRTFAPIVALFWLCFSDRGMRLLAWLDTGTRLWVSVLRVSFGALVVQSLAMVPFDFWIYQSLRAYGINHAPLGVWLSDYVKAFLMNAVPVLVVFLMVYFLTRRIRLWWGPGSVVPVRDQAAVAMMESLADRAGVVVGTMKEMITSDKGSTINAEVSGLGPTKQVLIRDTTLAQLNQQQLEVLLAHELSHAVHGDSLIVTIVQIGLVTLQIYLIFWFLQTFAASGALGLRLPLAPRALALILLVGVVLNVYTDVGIKVLHRSLEERADRYALELTGLPDAHVSLIQKVNTTNLLDPDPPALVEFLQYTHPSLMRRIRIGMEYSGP